MSTSTSSRCQPTSGCRKTVLVYLPHLLALAGIWVLVVMSPGPDFVVTVSRAAASRRMGLAAAAGIVLGTVVWASASAAGLELVLAHYRSVAEYDPAARRWHT